jgi:hypothetical protein
VGVGTVLLYGIALYAIAGICTAAAFVTCGATKVLGTPTSMTAGARVMIFPGTAALWPYVLVRWLKSRRKQ